MNFLSGINTNDGTGTHSSIIVNTIGYTYYNMYNDFKNKERRWNEYANKAEKNVKLLKTWSNLIT